MNFRKLTARYSVSPQISPDHMPAIAAAGFRTVICNRPDDEILPPLRAIEIRTACEAEGMNFVNNPILHSAFTRREVDHQYEAIAASAGATLAYCASGTRSAMVWMFGAVRDLSPEELVQVAEKAGFPLRSLLPQLRAVRPR
ncbi:TIGR01244 family sulfur transferase [Tropicimonas sp.]|uniref:TIGR01244 family sulfur transferase n=1 Tax=Tropicimonas sp. TaxID=2067044 RepID=UPI003A89F060